MGNVCYGSVPGIYFQNDMYAPSNLQCTGGIVGLKPNFASVWWRYKGGSDISRTLHTKTALPPKRALTPKPNFMLVVVLAVPKFLPLPIQNVR